MNLAAFAKDAVTVQKLYIQGNDDMYIEIEVKVKPGDAAPPKKAEPTPTP